jgi:hypothetical protein
MLGRTAMNAMLARWFVVDDFAGPVAGREVLGAEAT